MQDNMTFGTSSHLLTHSLSHFLQKKALDLPKSGAMNSREDSPSEARRGMVEIGAATVGFALWHSFLCSLPVKTRLTDALQKRGLTYRLFFNLQSAVTFGALILWILTRPKRTIYRFEKWKKLPFWLGQLTFLAICLWSVAHLQPARFLLGQSDDEPDAQGPNIHQNGKIEADGPFRWSRHPLEWAPMLLLFSTPHLKTNWLAFNVLGTIYSLFGALHEEKRLERASKNYVRYQKQVGFFFGRRKKS